MRRKKSETSSVPSWTSAVAIVSLVYAAMLLTRIQESVLLYWRGGCRNCVAVKYTVDMLLMELTCYQQCQLYNSAIQAVMIECS